MVLPAVAWALRAPGWAGLRPLRWPLLATALAAVLAWALSINIWLSLAGAYTRYESLLVRLAYLGILAGTAALCWRAPARNRVLGLFVLGCSVAALEAAAQAVTHELLRPDGNLGQAGLLGGLLAMALPAALQLGLQAWPWLATAIPLAVGLYLSSSRAGWLGAVADSVGALAVFVPRRWRQATAALAAAAVVGAVLVLLLSPLR
ncbi:MAG: hypothetical protein ABI838_06755, partial [Chloroflexota bacterium]